jgi:hypothetical protein
LKPFNFSNFGFFTAEPSCVNEAKGDKNWELALQDEIKAHAINKTWELVSLPPTGPKNHQVKMGIQE